MKDKIVLTGVKPTERPHVGNYYGAIKPAIELAQKTDRSMIFIADYHTLITVQNKQDMSRMILETTASFLASGVDPNKTLIYQQSDIPEILEINWILNCFTPKGLMNRAHAYKAKVAQNKGEPNKEDDYGVNLGLYCYPVLMAADILSFGADIVPVGPDQVQHIEIARDIAQKFNNTYGDVLKVPEFNLSAKEVLPGIDGRKMSKSYGNHIPLFEEGKKMRKKVMKIKTDSQAPDVPKDPDDSLVMDIFRHVASAEEIKSLEDRYRQGIGWGEAKQTLFECLEKEFAEKTERFNYWVSQPKKVAEVLNDCGQSARALAIEQLRLVKEAVGVKS